LGTIAAPGLDLGQIRDPDGIVGLQPDRPAEQPIRALEVARIISPRRLASEQRRRFLGRGKAAVEHEIDSLPDHLRVLPRLADLDLKMAQGIASVSRPSHGARRRQGRVLGAAIEAGSRRLQRLKRTALIARQRQHAKPGRGSGGLSLDHRRGKERRGADRRQRRQRDLRNRHQMKSP
jgi:hypothetical protein